ncbi:glycoside hydrolase family 16 protein [Hyaloscypha bicolor E]|uniref:Glycoside hydrolase family 16 protein n=1 Tax=Hyaloscypha bicolor E TaxID=1095630 RepID=A0A2J6T5B7_9HELO|nr:glycoside hydrolase family 16 protein [Hyaloscypha bicolor E]PMD58222.1 glycoside hydrolase family 16 protein [Hyaloscypha bicolor E]
MRLPKQNQVYLAQSTGIPSTSDRNSSQDISESKSHKFTSTRLLGSYEKPWLQDGSYKAREKMERGILLLCTCIGVAIAIIICGTQWSSVVVVDYCLILDDNFKIFNESAWSREVNTGGFGYGSFDWTTDDPKNSYVSDDGLHITPTLTLGSTNITADQLENGYLLNTTADGTCTSPLLGSCVKLSNSKNGTIINPVRSARLTTAGKVAIKYGKVEIVAKMPAGDWLLPMLWMYPEKETYGVWPRSGEIDIAQIRGNDPKHYSGGRDTVTSALHWGVRQNLDQSDRTTGEFVRRRYDLAQGFHTYGLEWTETKLYTWIDDENYKIEQTGWVSRPINIWSSTGAYNTPFDQPFHLIMNVAVGSSNGFFKDGKGGKPWVDNSTTAMRDFWVANSTWLPSWGEDADTHSMTVKSVKIWQQGKCGK